MIRLCFTRRHFVFSIVLGVAVLSGLCGYYLRSLRHAEAKVGELRTLTLDQHQRLEEIDAHATELDSELRALAHQNEQIRKLLGERSQSYSREPGPAALGKDGRQSLRAGDVFATVAARIDRLASDSARVRGDEIRLRGMAFHVLNVRRLEDLARARVLAAIPSVNPAGAGVAIRSAYGWRVDPWPEFHEGVDLDVDYGDPVRSAAAGTVASAAFEGGYGYKIDIDHGNGYHTWYCHLSRIDVRAGEYVTKAQHIALAGSTGASTGPHLHFQIQLDGRPVDPAPYLVGVPDRVLASLK